MLSSFFQALSQPFTGPSTSQSSRALFCNSLRESGIKYLYSNISETIKNAGSSKHLDIGKKRRKEGILPKPDSDIYYLFANNQRSQAGPKFEYHPGLVYQPSWLMPEPQQQGEAEREIVGRSKKSKNSHCSLPLRWNIFGVSSLSVHLFSQNLKEVSISENSTTLSSLVEVGQQDQKLLGARTDS